jgi:Rod binding domain-containing protein
MTQPVSRPIAHPAAAPGHRLASGATQAENAARLTKAAQDFTAVALGEMLKPMFDTLDSSGGPFGGGQGEQAWRPMMIDEIAKSIARQGGLGLSGPVAQAMLQMQEKAR